MILPGNIVNLIIAAALGMYVWIHARHYTPARLFLVVIVCFIVQTSTVIFRTTTTDAAVGYTAVAVNLIDLALLQTMVLLFLSALFVPQWWSGHRPIRLIAAPYVLLTLVLTIDLVGRMGWFISGVQFDAQTQSYNAVSTALGNSVLMLVFSAGWIVHLGILGMAWRRNPHVRWISAILLVLLALNMVFGTINARVSTLRLIFSTTQTLLPLVAFTYLVMRRQLFQPMAAALQLAIQALNDAVVVMDLQGRVIYANGAAVQLGFQPNQAFATALRARCGATDAVEQLIQHQAQAQGLSLEAVEWGDGRIFRTTLTTVPDQRHVIVGTLLLAHDITQLEQRNQLLADEQLRLADAVQQLDHLASHDPLTNLPNRRSLESALHDVLVTKTEQYNALFFIDLDQFKLVNDTLGHQAGDQVLIQMARILTRQLRSDDVLVRLGGDEFAVLLCATNLAQASAVAERMRDTVHRYPFVVHDRPFNLGLSIGVKMIDGTEDATAVLAHADIAMYSAKERGGNQVVIYAADDVTFTQLFEANEWVSRIKSALHEQRLVLHYQPIIELATGHVLVYETLIRIRDETGTIVPPRHFIATADRFGLMEDLDRWVLHQAVRLLQHHPHVCLSVNICGRSLSNTDLLDTVAQWLTDADVAPQRLSLEISERTLMQNGDRAPEWIQRLHELGFTCLIDGFGLGCSSIGYLDALPITHVKIAGTLIQALHQPYGQRRMVEALVALLNKLDKTIIAEWVEHPEIIDVLHTIGIRYGQGYALGEPLDSLPAPVC